MARTETVEFTNMCMICDGSRVVVIDRKKRDWPGITFPGGHIEPGESFTDAVIREVQEETGLHIRSPQLCGIKDWCENQCRLLCCFIRQLVLIIKTKPLVKLFFEKEKKSKKRIEKATVYLLFASGDAGKEHRMQHNKNSDANVEIRCEAQATKRGRKT